MLERSFHGLVLFVLLAAAAGAAEPTPPESVAVPQPNAINEYAPKDVYVRGDPMPLTRENSASGRRLNFVGCPIIRDSAPTPCWLIEHEGELYFLRAQQNLSSVRVYPPQLLHEVLVEGVVSDEPRLCGGIVLNPLRLSVLREVNPACNKMLPEAGERIEIAKRPPGPGPSGRLRSNRVGARVALADSVEHATDAAREAGIPRTLREYEILFEFDSDFVREYEKVLEAAKYAQDIGAGRIEVHGERGSVLLTNGQKMYERVEVAASRARKIAAIIGDYRRTSDGIATFSAADVAEPDGINDFATRRARIVVRP